MATEDKPLERAVVTLVREFHRAANNSPSMSISQFRTLVSRHIPAAAQMVEDEENLRWLLQQMDVQRGQNISFENFWKFVKLQANEQFVIEKKGYCTCLLQ